MAVTPYRESSPYAFAVIGALAASALFDGWIAFAGKAFRDGAPAAATLIKLHVVLRFATACAFLTWFDAAYANLIAIRGVAKHPRWWAIGGFFIPPFALFRPCEIATEIWRSTSTRDAHPIVVYVWWAAFLQMIVLFIVGRPFYYVASILAAGLAITTVVMLNNQLDAARLEMQRDERRLLREQRTANVLRTAQTASATSSAIAPHIAAIDALNAARAAERRIDAPAPSAKTAVVEQTASRPAYAAPAVGSPAPPAVVPPPNAIAPDSPERAPATGIPRAAVVPRLVVSHTWKAPGPIDHGAIWRIFISISLAAVGLALLVTAADVGFADAAVSHLVGVIYLVSGVTLVFIASLVRRLRTTGPADGWILSAIAAAFIAAANIVVVAWFAEP